jgi:hypothetical protein
MVDPKIEIAPMVSLEIDEIPGQLDIDPLVQHHVE